MEEGGRRKLWKITKQLDGEDSRGRKVTLGEDGKMLTGKQVADHFARTYQKESNRPLSSFTQREARREQRERATQHTSHDPMKRERATQHTSHDPMKRERTTQHTSHDPMKRERATQHMTPRREKEPFNTRRMIPCREKEPVKTLHMIP